MLYLNVVTHRNTYRAMQIPAENYRTIFFHHLKPFLDMLEYQQTVMDAREWGATVYRIASGIESNPGQYLGLDLPNHEVTIQLVRDIFDEFIQVHPPLIVDAMLAP